MEFREIRLSSKRCTDAHRPRSCEQKAALYQGPRGARSARGPRCLSCPRLKAMPPSARPNKCFSPLKVCHPASLLGAGLLPDWVCAPALALAASRAKPRAHFVTGFTLDAWYTEPPPLQRRSNDSMEPNAPNQLRTPPPQAKHPLGLRGRRPVWLSVACRELLRSAPRDAGRTGRRARAASTSIDAGRERSARGRGRPRPRASTGDTTPREAPGTGATSPAAEVDETERGPVLPEEDQRVGTLTLQADRPGGGVSLLRPESRHQRGDESFARSFARVCSNCHWARWHRPPWSCRCSATNPDSGAPSAARVTAPGATPAFVLCVRRVVALADSDRFRVSMCRVPRGVSMWIEHCGFSKSWGTLAVLVLLWLQWFAATEFGPRRALGCLAGERTNER